MPEAVIVSAARSPIGRAVKGSLAGLRPDDLTTQIVRAALDKTLAGAALAKDRAGQALTQVMIPEALDYPL